MAEAKREEKANAEANPLNKISALKDDPERQAFVIKVYTIVFCQMLLTCAFSTATLMYEPLGDFLKQNFYLYYVAMIIGISVMCSLLCCIQNARKVPLNYILLFVFTAAWTVMVASFIQFFDIEDIVMAATLTTCLFLGLTLFACCSKFKLTALWGVGAAISVCLWPMIIFMWIFPSKMLYNVICFLVVVLTSIYIVYDTKLIMKKLSLDDYVIGALLLYVDIIQLFMHILALMGNN